MNGNEDGDGARTGTETAARVEASEGAKYGNGDGSGNGAGTGTGTGVETRECRQDENGDGSGDENESSSGDGNGDEDGHGDGNEDGIGEGGRVAKKRKNAPKHCRRNQARLSRTHHYLGNQGVPLAGTRQLCSQGLVPMHAHCTERVTGSEGREGSNGVRRGIEAGGGNGEGNGGGGGNGDGAGAGRVTGTEVEANEGT